MRYSNQNLDQPPVLVTASTGKAAINGIILYSAFHLLVKSGWKSEYKINQSIKRQVMKLFIC